MSNTKKKRKLIIKATGAGDPTYFLEFNIPTDPTDPTSNDPLAITINAVLGNNQDQALLYDSATMPAFPISTDIQLGSNFVASNVIAPSAIPVSITFTNDEYDFIFEAPPQMNGVSNGNTISFPSITQQAAGNITLASTNNVIFQSLEDHDQGSLVFLSEDGMTLSTKSIFGLLDNKNNWVVTEINSVQNLYTIQNKESLLFLAITSGNTLGMSNDGSTAAAQWNITKVSTTTSNYSIAITQNGTEYFLYSSSLDESVALVNRSSDWYLYIN